MALTVQVKMYWKGNQS